MKKDGYNVAIVGASGAVGQEMMGILEERNFPVREIKLLASERSAGKELEFKNNKIKIEKLGNNSFENIDIALFSAGSSRSREFAPIAAQSGAVVIDNSSAFRMEEGVPLVIPEINPHVFCYHAARGYGRAWLGTRFSAGAIQIGRRLPRALCRGLRGHAQAIV